MSCIKHIAICITIMATCNMYTSWTQTLVSIATTHETYIWHIVDHAIQKEQASPHAYCFYHGMSQYTFTAILANTYLDHLIHGTPLTDDFYKLRHDADLYSHNEAIHTYIQNNIHDLHEPYKSHLLSVNLSFPGNVHNSTENTMHFFKHNHNTACSDHLFSYIAKQYARSHEEQETITQALHNFYANIRSATGGVVLQIIIPKHLAQTCMYISTGCGVPHDQARKNPTYSIDVLEAYQNDQAQLEKLLKQEDATFHACGLQARLRLDTSLFSEPGKIQIYAYHTLGNDVCTQLYNKLQDIIMKQ